MQAKLILVMITMTNSLLAQTSFKAERIQKSASFKVNAKVEKAFPLFGPIREKEWAADWEPQLIFSPGAEVEEHMVFKTTARQHGEGEYLWMITQHRPKDFFIEYTVSTAQRIWFVSVKCRPHGQNTNVTVTYSFTGLTEEGNRMNELALNNMYANNLKDWEEDINYYLATGKRKEH
jgi:hypothetical protein